MIDIDDIRSRYQLLGEFLGERGRRLFAANEALAQGYGGVSATARATGIARSTIDRGIAELRAGGNGNGMATRRPGGGRKACPCEGGGRRSCINRGCRPRLRH